MPFPKCASSFCCCIFLSLVEPAFSFTNFEFSVTDQITPGSKIQNCLSHVWDSQKIPNPTHLQIKSGITEEHTIMHPHSPSSSFTTSHSKEQTQSTRRQPTDANSPNSSSFTGQDLPSWSFGFYHQETFPWSRSDQDTIVHDNTR